MILFNADEINKNLSILLSVDVIGLSITVDRKGFKELYNSYVAKGYKVTKALCDKSGQLVGFTLQNKILISC